MILLGRAALLGCLLAVVATWPVESADTPRAAIQVSQTGASRGEPCPPIDATGGRFVRGGCRGVANAYATTLNVRTAFGRMKFGDCTTNFDMTFGADGEIWLDKLMLSGARPCGDVRPCAPPSVLALREDGVGPPPMDKVPPWRGRVLAVDGGDVVSARFRFCIDTCLGRYDGDLDVRLTKRDGRWRMRAESAGLRGSGLEVDGEWDVFGLAADFKQR